MKRGTDRGLDGKWMDGQTGIQTETLIYGPAAPGRGTHLIYFGNERLVWAGTVGHEGIKVWTSVSFPKTSFYDSLGGS